MQGRLPGASRPSRLRRSTEDSSIRQAACSADYDNDGRDDLLVTYWGQNRLFHNRGDGTFEDVTDRAGLKTSKPRWGAGCAFLDYDRDGRLDLFVANYIDFDLASAPVPEKAIA